MLRLFRCRLREGLHTESALEGSLFFLDHKAITNENQIIQRENDLIAGEVFNSVSPPPLSYATAKAKVGPASKASAKLGSSRDPVDKLSSGDQLQGNETGIETVDTFFPTESTRQDREHMTRENETGGLLLNHEAIAREIQIIQQENELIAEEVTKSISPRLLPHRAARTVAKRTSNESKEPATTRASVEKHAPRNQPPKHDSVSVHHIESIGKTYAKKLNEMGIETVSELLQIGSTRQGRKRIIRETQISEKRILKWINMADLFRIEGIEEKYARLLEHAGAHTIKTLRHRNPEHLLEAMNVANRNRRLVKRMPGLHVVTDWVQQAKSLKPKVEY